MSWKRLLTIQIANVSKTVQLLKCPSFPYEEKGTMYQCTAHMCSNPTLLYYELCPIPLISCYERPALKHFILDPKSSLIVFSVVLFFWSHYYDFVDSDVLPYYGLKNLAFILFCFLVVFWGVVDQHHKIKVFW